MLRLTLLRHAKSGWDNPELADHERELTCRGIKAANRTGRYIAENDLTPNLILCSDATRTRATLAFILTNLSEPHPQTTITEDLYHAAPNEILRAIQREAGKARHILVIGHNPGLHALALSLPKPTPAGSSSPEMLTQLAMKFPTAALASISFELTKWTDVGPQTGTLERYVMPRALKD